MSKGVVAVLGPSASPASNSIISNICGEKEVSAGWFSSILYCAVAHCVSLNNHTYHWQFCSHMLCSKAIQIPRMSDKCYDWCIETLSRRLLYTSLPDISPVFSGSLENVRILLMLIWI